jgi:peptidoglycan hydrolase CwlO-like protein
VDDFQKKIENISKKLDNLELEIAMSQEALESIEIRLRLLNTELEFEAQGPINEV